MKHIKHIPVSIGIFLLSLTSCMHETDDTCLPEAVYFSFHCINTNYFFPDIVRELELLFFYPDGILAHQYAYTFEELKENQWKVALSEQKPGKYTVLAHVNYINNYTDVTGRPQKETLLTELKTGENREIHYTPSDTYYGKYELNLTYDIPGYEHKMMLSKNTNHIALIVRFDHLEDFKNCTGIDSRIEGYNARYIWDNTAPTQEKVIWYPVSNTFTDRQLFSDLNTIMRIWTEANLKLYVQINGPVTRDFEIDIPEALHELENFEGKYLYDTDEKLEQYDYFTFEIRVGNNFIITAVTINGWYLIKYEEDI